MPNYEIKTIQERRSLYNVLNGIYLQVLYQHQFLLLFDQIVNSTTGIDLFAVIL